MGLAEDIAGKVGKKSSDEEATSPDAEGMKSGDIGKRILSAIKQNDAIALETAILDLNE